MQPRVALDPNASAFSVAAGAVLSGRLPLFPDLNRKQRRAGHTDCVIVAIHPEWPCWVGLAVLEQRACRVCVSFKRDLVTIGSDEEPRLNDVGARGDEFARMVTAALDDDDNGVVFVMDRILCLGLLAGFTDPEPLH